MVRRPGDNDPDRSTRRRDSLPRMTQAPQVMGVVNVTPDSFSDGGLFLDAESAIAHGRQLLADGADILDVGGESTRPGATRPLVEEELGRVVPVIEALAADGAIVSVDTMRAEVATAALAAGARVVNDVSGGLADPTILDVVADAAPDVRYVAMHWRAHSDRMGDYTSYDGHVAAVVADELRARVDAIRAAGIDDARVVLDPGLGFAKTPDQNWQLLGRIGVVQELGFPVLVGASRKRFLGDLLAEPDGTPRPVGERELAHAAIVATLVLHGVWGVRVHDVRATRDVLAAMDRLGRER
jgi:dihydropteroate synthase